MFEIQMPQLKGSRSLIMPLLVWAGVILSIAGCHTRGLAPPGVHNGKLSGCPDSPNCVSTESMDESHAIAPLTFATSSDAALGCLKRIITGMKRAKIVQADGSYIHAELRTLLGFADDVEFFIEEKNHTIQMRSASRLGYSDFGVNRRRLEKIRTMLERECG